MNLEEKEDIARFIVDIFEGQGETYPDTPVLRDGVKSIILIEHDMGVVMDLADRIVVLASGARLPRAHRRKSRTIPLLFQLTSAIKSESRWTFWN